MKAVLLLYQVVIVSVMVVHSGTSATMVTGGAPLKILPQLPHIGTLAMVPIIFSVPVIVNTPAFRFVVYGIDPEPFFILRFEFEHLITILSLCKLYQFCHL